MEKVLDIKRIDRLGPPDLRLRPATEDEMRQMNEDGRYVDLDAACRDWLLQTSFDGNSWPHIHRDKSLPEILAMAEESADGICSVFFRPATAEEIKEDNAERAEYQRELEKQELGRLKGIRRGQIIGIIVQIVLTPLLAYWGWEIMSNHQIMGLLLFGLAALSAINLLWALLKHVIYQISFAIGKGLGDGRARRM